MDAAAFLASLRERDVRLWMENGRLKCDAPAGVLDDALRSELARRRQELIALVEGAHGTVSAPRSVVPLKATGTQPALFARPGHNGDVFCYRTLAAYFDPDRPLYGVEPKSLQGGPLAESVEEMAAYEVEQIRAAQPGGPYFLAGFCAGGTVAFEAARQLAASGQEVARVLLFGCPFPTSYRAAAQLEAQIRSLGRRVQRHAAALAAAGSVSEGLAYLRGRANAREEERAAEGARSDDPVQANQQRMGDATLELVKRYEPEFYAGRLDVFIPNEAWRHSLDRPGEWKRYAARVVEHLGPEESNGDTMLREPHVRALASLVAVALRGDGRSGERG